jgi:ribose 1,5-bisphosphokinase
MRPFIYVMGPSGAGKDSVLGGVRAAAAPGDRIAVAHRYITRPTERGGENYVSLSPGEFEARRAAGLFAYHWSAHGCDYGIGVEVHAWRRAGFAVVISGSRAHFRALRERRIIPIVITAAPEILAQRLTARGRETPQDIEQRLVRRDQYAVDHPDLVTIDNSGPIENSVQGFLSAIRGLPRETVLEALALSGFR